ncbi:unnamed protein product [Prorocentrum cordatum]|uniref:Integrase catalytic domain-containing protein n=1 Tax=Prorocentrum cordatum TaxID=2364126 RepID=A0ABN9VK88_9DINO|nr:unnamed protein product [Polarella glacialis]
MAQIDTGADWTQWDMGRAIQGLRSAVPGMVQRPLRRMHIRLWHAPAERLRDLLSAAGLPREVINMVQDVVDTCTVCREWQRRGEKPVTSLTFTTTFNEGIQFDLLFLDDGIVVHLIDMCIRWAQGLFVKSKEPGDVLPAITHIWFRVHGPPKFITSDQEGALFSDEGAIWADRWKVDLRPKPKGAHAHVIERRNDLLRTQYHRVRSQANEGIRVSKEELLDESLLAMNTLLSSGGAVSRHVHRVRELALANIAQGNARERLKIAARTRTRPAAQLGDLRVGDSVDIFRDPPNKDVTGWRGPCKVVAMDRADEGIIDVRWQGRTLPCRPADVRKAVTWLTLMAAPGRGDTKPYQLLVYYVENMAAGTTLLLGYEIGEDGHWRMTKTSRRLPTLTTAAFHVAACDFHLYGVLNRCPTFQHHAVKYGLAIRMMWKNDQIDGIAGPLQRQPSTRSQRHLNLRLKGWLIPEMRRTEFSFFHAILDSQSPPDAEYWLDSRVLEAVEVATYLENTEKEMQVLEVEFESEISRLVIMTTDAHDLPKSEIFSLFANDGGHRVILSVNSTGKTKMVIEREADELNKDDLIKHRVEVEKAMSKELGNCIELGALKQRSRLGCTNLMDSRWVIRWKKQPDGKLAIKARLCIKGFKDLQQDRLDTFSATASRQTQRIVNFIAASRPKWVLWSCDVGSAFLKGLTFQDVAYMTGEPLRTVQLDLPKDTVKIARQFEPLSNYDVSRHCLEMVRPGFGLKDAPRLWNLKLKQVMTKLQLLPLVTYSQFYCKWAGSRCEPVPRELVPMSADKDKARGTDVSFTDPEIAIKDLQMVCSTRVDDLKEASTDPIADAFMDALESEFGKLTRQKRRHQRNLIFYIYCALYAIDLKQACIPQIAAVGVYMWTASSSGAVVEQGAQIVQNTPTSFYPISFEYFKAAGEGYRINGVLVNNITSFETMFALLDIDGSGGLASGEFAGLPAMLQKLASTTRRLQDDEDESPEAVEKRRLTAQVCGAQGQFYCSFDGDCKDDCAVCGWKSAHDRAFSTCVVPSATACHADQERVYCPTDELCKVGGCSDCPGRPRVDFSQHTCLATWWDPAPLSTWSNWVCRYRHKVGMSCIHDQDCIYGLRRCMDQSNGSGLV